MAITVNQLTLEIGTTSVCRDLSVEFKAGQFWAILGVNGVGKSTFLHQLINTKSPQSRCISVNDIGLSRYKNRQKSLAKISGLLLQEYEYNFPCSVLEAALIGRHPHMSNWQWESDEDIRIAEEALKATALYDLKDRNIKTLSGGEKRRLNLATVLTQNPQYFLLDEPTNHLDLKSQITILKLLSHKITRKNKTGIMVIHDANLAYQYCDHVLLFYGNGEWDAGKTQELITVENLRRVYDCNFQVMHNRHTSVFVPYQEGKEDSNESNKEDSKEDSK